MCKCVVKCLWSKKKLGDLIYVMRPYFIYSFVDLKKINFEIYNDVVRRRYMSRFEI